MPAKSTHNVSLRIGQVRRFPAKRGFIVAEIEYEDATLNKEKPTTRTAAAEGGAWEEELCLSVRDGVDGSIHLTVVGVDEHGKEGTIGRCTLNTASLATNEYTDFRLGLLAVDDESGEWQPHPSHLCLQFEASSSLPRTTDPSRSVLAETVSCGASRVSQSDISGRWVEVTVLHGVDIAAAEWKGAGGRGASGEVTTYVTACLPGVKGAEEWQQTLCQQGAHPAWNETIRMNAAEEQSTAPLLELRLFEKSSEKNEEDRFLGQGIVRLEGMAEGRQVTFRVALGIVGADGSVRTQSMVLRQLYIRVCLNNFSTLRMECARWAYITQTQRGLARKYVETTTMTTVKGSAVHLRSNGILGHSDSPFVLEMLVKEAKQIDPAQLLDVSDLYVRLQWDDVVMTTDVASTSNSKWDETFRLGLSVFGTSSLKVSFHGKYGRVTRPLGMGIIDLMALPWHRTASVECEVRLVLCKQVVGIVTVVLTQVPRGAMWMWREYREEWFSLHSGLELLWYEMVQWETEERGKLIMQQEEEQRNSFWMSYEAEWWMMWETISVWMTEWRVYVSSLCSMRIKVAKATRLYHSGECHVVAEWGNQWYKTCSLRCSSKGVMAWNEECTLRTAGMARENWRYVNEPLRLHLFVDGALVGTSEVRVDELRFKTQWECTVSFGESMVHLYLEALDFGIIFEEDEEPQVDVTIVNATNLPYKDADGDGLCEPFIQLKVEGGDSYTTSTKTGTSPVWNESFHFLLPKGKDPEEQHVDLYVCDRDKKGGHHDDMMGSLSIPLKGLIRDQSCSFRLGLRIQQSGVTVQNSYVLVRVCPRGFGTLPEICTRTSTPSPTPSLEAGKGMEKEDSEISNATTGPKTSAGGSSASVTKRVDVPGRKANPLSDIMNVTAH